MENKGEEDDDDDLAKPKESLTPKDRRSSTIKIDARFDDDNVDDDDDHGRGPSKRGGRPSRHRSHFFCLSVVPIAILLYLTI